MRRLLSTVALALALALAACDPKQFTGFTPDSITITVTGLPNDLQPDITITGPGDYQQEITETTKLEELAPGTYTLTVDTVEFRGNPFEPDKTTHRLTLEPGGAKSALVRYAPHRAYSQAALEHLNDYRQAAGVPPASMDADGSLPNWLHARYLAENRTSGHEEDPNLPWYTPEGHEAGRRSNVSVRGGDQRDDPAFPVLTFVDAPFHFFNLLDPRTTTVRLGYYHRLGEGCSGGSCDLGGSSAALEPIRDGTWPAGKTIHFPSDGQTINDLEHGGERPSPLTACEGYESPAGTPIFVMHGRDSLPTLTNTSLTLAGQPVEHCTFTASTYTNPDPDQLALARSILDGYGALVIVPRQPLQASATYEVSVTYATGADRWSFHTAATTIPYGETTP